MHVFSEAKFLVELDGSFVPVQDGKSDVFAAGSDTSVDLKPYHFGLLMRK